MATMTSRSAFSATTVTEANLAIDSYIDGIYAAANAGYTPGAIVMVLNMEIVSDTGDTTTYTSKMRVTARASAYGTLKTNLDSLTTEMEDMVTINGDFDEVTGVTGTVTLTLTYA